MERAIAYIRVSTDRQVTDGTSLHTQRRRVDEYLAAKGYELVRLFVEEGESAKTAKRPVLQEMLTFCKQHRGRVDLVVFPKIDRFARYSEDYYFLKRYLRNLGIRLESTDERFDDSPAGRYMESMLAASAQYDNEIRAERCRGGMAEAARSGRYVFGKAPIGYRNVRYNGLPTIEPDPAKGPLIVEAFGRVALGRQRVCDVRLWLNEQGIGISRNQLYRLLKRRVYLGVIDAFGLQIQGQPPFVPLVSERIFLGAQQALAPRRPFVQQRDREEFPLRGTAKCACGQYMTASWSQGRTKRYPYYRCKLCSRVNFEANHMATAFQYLLWVEKQRYLLGPDERAELVREWSEESASVNERKELWEREISALESTQKALALKSAQGIIPDEVASAQFQDLRRKILERKALLEGIISGAVDCDVVLAFAQGFLDKLETYWEAADLPTKKHVQRFFFPSGATIEKRGSRTALRAFSTGSKRLDRNHLLQAVDLRHKNTNFVRNSGQVDLDHGVTNLNPSTEQKKLDFYRALYREFGPEDERNGASDIAPGVDRMQT